MKANFSRRKRVLLKSWFVTDVDWYTGVWNAAGANFNIEEFERLKKQFSLLIDGDIDADEIPPADRSRMAVIVETDLIWLDLHMENAIEINPVVITMINAFDYVYGIRSSVVQLNEILKG